MIETLLSVTNVIRVIMKYSFSQLRCHVGASAMLPEQMFNKATGCELMCQVCVASTLTVSAAAAYTSAFHDCFPLRSFCRTLLASLPFVCFFFFFVSNRSGYFVDFSAVF